MGGNNPEGVQMIEYNIEWLVSNGFTVEIQKGANSEYFVEVTKGKIQTGGWGGLNKALAIAVDNAQDELAPLDQQPEL